MYKLSNKSLSKLSGCHHDLQSVFSLAIKLTKYDFGISCGLRAIEEQEKLFESGASLTMNSRHLPDQYGLSNAVDIVVYVDGKATWQAPHYRKVSAAIFKAAFQLGIEIEWGGHFETLNDQPHYQLPKV